MSIKIILVDDHFLVKKGIRSSLETFEDIQIIAEASDGEQAIKLVEEHNPDVLVTDITMPGMNGLELCKKVADNINPTKVLILSMHDDDDYILNAFDCGAMGYISKDSSEEEIHEAIVTISEGNKYMTERVYKVLANQFIRNNKVSDEERLTAREKEIVKEIVNGLNNKQIADKLFISARTVDTHRTNIMRKLKANNTAELVRIAIVEKLA